MRRYSITDIDGFCKTIREHAAMSLTDDELYTENLNDFINLSQVKTIIQNLSLGVDEDGYEIISDETFNSVLDEVRIILYQSALCKMAAAGHIECGWDEDVDEMTFWIDDNKERLDIPAFPDYYKEDAENE
jgi:hypothetical protein